MLGSISRKAGKWILPAVGVMVLAVLIVSTFYPNDAMAASITKEDCKGAGGTYDSPSKGDCSWTPDTLETAYKLSTSDINSIGLTSQSNIRGTEIASYYTSDPAKVAKVASKINTNSSKTGITSGDCIGAAGGYYDVSKGTCSWSSDTLRAYSVDLSKFTPELNPRGEEIANYSTSDPKLVSSVKSAKATYDAKVAAQKLKDDEASCNNTSGKTWNSKTNTCDSSTSTSTSTCNVSAGVGWIVCPLANLMASIVDGTYGLMNKLFVVPIGSFTDQGSNSVYSIYANNMLPLANIILVIVFLVIIYSEATGNGFGAMSNYGVKKTLPKLIVFAILINVSFYICVAAVDISNIVGSSTEQFLSGNTTVDFTGKTSQFLKDGKLDSK